MQVVEKLNEGLKRELEVVFFASDLFKELDDKIEQAKSTVSLKGFRVGKVPASYLRKNYGKSFMAEIINEKLSSLPATLLNDRGEKPALRPEISLGDDEAFIERILNNKEDAKVLLKYEILPNIDIKDFSKLEVNRLVADISQAEKDKQLEEIFSQVREFKEKKSAAVLGDRITIDYLGKIADKVFEGGADKDVQLVLGANKFIPGFEEQLVGLKAGAEKVIAVTFPEDYGAKSLAGKDATFEIKVKKVEKAGEFIIDDESAKKLGAESVEQLKQYVDSQLESKYGAITRQKVKRQILDFLDSEYDFMLPGSLVDMEIKNIEAQVQGDSAKDHDHDCNEHNCTEHNLQSDEWESLAKRRVKLGLVLASIGASANVQVGQEELQRALFQQLQYFPGQEKELLNLFQNNPTFVENLKAPIFEDKVIDHILASVKVNDISISPEKLMHNDEELEIKPKAKKKASTKKVARDDVSVAKNKK
ncbi:trigger factor [Bartonella sp. TP]|uniref:trigger factor n=1 Tax=Bartonella sp. TP TaxID=3057550 RepID=UPI0025AF56D0|nr:trigger factor [Bartonella sp. TP]MDN5248666.1 trigger factor [Alphaproteobacteria bacterium]MDN5248851.1 trigger factor [Alphaproteobacteria bacterium]WJW79852.1 trigger factor [Bartonella sp. TP]